MSFCATTIGKMFLARNGSGYRRALASSNFSRSSPQTLLRPLSRTSSLHTTLLPIRTDSRRTTLDLKRTSSPNTFRTNTTLPLDPTSSSDLQGDASIENAVPADHSLGHFYFDSVFPLSLGVLDPRFYLGILQGSLTLEDLKKSLPDREKIGYAFKVLRVESREKDGGAFVLFSYKPEPGALQDARKYDRLIPKGTAFTSDEAATLSAINARFRPHLQPINRLGLTSLLPERFRSKPSVHIVLGTPWLEDLARYPSRTIQVNFQPGGASVSEQQLWDILRPYGKLHSLEINVKENKASAVFTRIRSAAAARNCLYGAAVAGQKLAIDYIPPGHFKKMWDSITSHPRIVLPVLAFFLGSITYAVFDPIRTFFIKSSVMGTFDVDNYSWFTWLRKNTTALFESGSSNTNSSSVDDWWERKAAVAEIQGWLREAPASFITIAGPQGSGKHSLLKRSLHNKSIKHISISCDEIAHSAKNEEAALVPAVARQVGYFPIFNWVSKLNNLIDLAAVGLIGSKAGFSTPSDAQLKQVLNLTTAALAEIKDETIRKKEKEAKRAAKRNDKAGAKRNDVKAPQSLSPTPAIGSEKISSAATPETAATQEADELGPDAKYLVASEPIAADNRGFDAPVVVMDGFHHKGLQSEMLWNVLANWAADITTSGVAHVVFVTDNPVQTSKVLGRSLPNRPMQSIVLADADKEKARSYVFSKLKELHKIDSTKHEVQATPEGPQSKSTISSLFASPTPDVSQTPTTDTDTEYIDLLGGRSSDLETLVQKVALGHTVETAVKEMISRTVIEIRKKFFGDDIEDAKSLPWSRGQAWLIVEGLAKQSELPYYSSLHSSLKGDESALKAMEQAELITVRHTDGRPNTIRAGRPVLLQAIRVLVADDVFADTQRFLSNTASIESASKDIRAAEAEMRELGECLTAAGAVAKSSQATRDRFEYLINILAVNQGKIRKLEESNSHLSKRLSQVSGDNAKVQ